MDKPVTTTTKVYIQTIKGTIYQGYGGESNCIPYTKSVKEARRKFEEFEAFELHRLDGEAP